MRSEPTPTAEVSLGGFRDTSRLHLTTRLSYRGVGRALELPMNAMGKYVSPATVAGVDWQAAQTHTGVLTNKERHAGVFTALKLKRPANDAQLTLL